MTSLSPLAQEQIARLHRECIDSRLEILRLLREACARGTTLTSGVSRKAALRHCQLKEIREDSLSLFCHDFSSVEGRHYYFTLDLDSDAFFFVSRLRSSVKSWLEFEIPVALYRSERREAQRSLPASFGIKPVAALIVAGRPAVLVRDVSRDGLGIGVPPEIAADLPFTFELEVAAESGEQRRLFAEVRNKRATERSFWSLGLSVSSVPNSARMRLEQAQSFFEKPAGWKRIVVASQVARVGVDRVWRSLGPSTSEEDLSVIRFQNQLGQGLVGLVNSTGVQQGAPVVLIPPAWGKTKETLLPLALSIVETCREHGLSVSVVRFDGTNRRGESFVDHDCRSPGDEYCHFRFSQAVQDLKAAMRFVRESEEFRAPRCVIVSFSLSAIESRRVVADALAGEVAGWIPVVGMVDLQSGLRAVSGGVDYAEGILKGVEFGRHELVGVLADMDLTGRDAIAAGLVFREDARRDMARIHVPITWIYGDHDGWIDVKRVRDVLLAGASADRRLVRVPTGHQLRTSHEALRTFELIGSEVVRMLWGKLVVGTRPALRVIDRVREAEARRRQSRTGVDLRAFWREYLLGRNGLMGMELLTATSTYHEMMQRQIEGLAVSRSCRILDLGSGTGAFLHELTDAGKRPGLVVALDIIIDALRRRNHRLEAQVPAVAVQADLDSGATLPFGDESFDAILASLLLSYLRNPSSIIGEISRVMRPSARLVVSSLRRDADISSIYNEGVSELVAGGAERSASGDDLSFAEAQRSFLNEAARLVDLEEQGLFRFYDEDELRALAEGAGLRVVSVERALGDPPQAIVMAAERVN